MQCVNITEILKSRSFRPGDESLLAVSDVSSLSQELLIVDVSVVLSTKGIAEIQNWTLFFFFFLLILLPSSISLSAVYLPRWIWVCNILYLFLMQIKVTNGILFHMDEFVELLPGQPKLLAGEGLKSLKGHRVDRWRCMQGQELVPC